jgi:hypothetical protein
MVVEHKDVIVSILGAAVGLAGLLLVFSGFLFSQAASFPPDTSDKIINKYRNVARVAIYPFLGFLSWPLSSVPKPYPQTSEVRAQNQARQVLCSCS